MTAARVTGRRQTLALVAAALVLCAALATAALAASTNFDEPASSPEPAGDAPLAIATADFDGDSDQDLALANFFDDDVTVLRNDGSGDFVEPGTSPEAVPATQAPRSIAAADFDGDGDGDLAVGNDFPADVTILRSVGSAGNFTERSSSPEATSGAFALTAFDFDGDGDPDLAAADPQSGDITILRNNGSGNFSERSSSPEAGGVMPTTLEAADLDGDGDQDLVAGSQNSFDITILRNNGSGNFSERSSSPEPTGDEVDDLVAADQDGDGDQDLAAAGGQELVSVLQNNGSGNFSERSSSPEAAGDLPTSIVAADFDADGDQDLAVGNFVSDDATILRNNGSGNFAEPSTSPEFFPNAAAMVTADLDGDGDPDLAGTDSGGDAARILLNR
jgi:hypothetical protein